MLSKETLAEISAHAEETYPNECCGFVVQAGGKEIYIKTDNVASEPNKFMQTSATAWADAEDMGEITVFVHSHPDESPKPSEADLTSMEASGVPWLIVSVREGKVVETSLSHPSGYQAPLIGRPFYHGVLDCYTLVQDWYKMHRGILLKTYAREDVWWKKGQDLYVDNFKNEGFTTIAEDDTPRPGDLILMAIRSPVTNHAAVYLDKEVLHEGMRPISGAMLHHLYGRPSERAIYGGYWQSVTTHIIRHKDLA